MLTLILGRAKSGKTTRIMEKIRSLVQARQENTVLLVPEQYSHEAETELLRCCGDSMSLYAEVLSFSRLAGRVEAELGRRVRLLDKGGRLLCMALALDAVGSRLKVYGSARRQAELQESLLATLDELKSACIDADMLEHYAFEHDDMLSDKLGDIALIYQAYDAIVSRGHLDPSDRLTNLSEMIGLSALSGGAFFIDGFTDFTRQELGVISALISSGADITVCLTCEGLEESHEIFESSRKAALALERAARSAGSGINIVHTERTGELTPMAAIERELFSFKDVKCAPGGSVTLRSAPTVSLECEAAAAECISLVRDRGCRWRDIAIAVRGYEDHRAVLESVFARYGIPLYSAGKSGISSKPLTALISSAFDIVAGGWSYEDVFSYLKTGLAGLDAEECDKLENYAFMWSIHASAWTRSENWHMHPDGYNAKFTDDTQRQLDEINLLRRRVTEPLMAFARAGREASTALEQARALSELFDAIDLPTTLSRRSKQLRELGLDRQAAEYTQLWEIVVNALEQCAGTLGNTELSQESFGKLFSLVLSKYDVGTIPLSLDKVSAGDMDRMRRRSIKHLLVLGCDNSRIPSVQSGAGIFTDDDRETLLSAGIDIGDTPSDRLCHEFALIYNCMTLPSESIYVSFSSTAGGDGQAMPSFVMERLSGIFDAPILPADIDDARSCAPAPAFDLAVGSADRSRSLPELAAEKYFRLRGESERIEQLRSAARSARGSLSRSAVSALYGSKLRLSASRIDKFSSCRFAYFLQYGLRAKPRQAAAFSPPEMGTFMHFVLERTASEINALGGFKLISDEQAGEICKKYVELYIHENLNDFSEKTPRFIYLFRRLTSNVQRVVTDMVHELARSDFKPLDFELNFSDASAIPPIELGSGDNSLVLTGIADRVDGWYHDGKLYLRVVDYKTGRKEFSLSDVWYGMGLQMLLYLFALERDGRELYGGEIVPAGVLYVPARDVLLSVKADISDDEILAQKAKALCRKGLLLDDAQVLAAMERGDRPMYIPVTLKDGAYSGDALASAQQLGLLSRHIYSTLCALASELRSGSITADPYFRTQADCACTLCDYREACLFDEGHDHRRYLPKLKNAQVWELIEKGGENNGL